MAFTYFFRDSMTLELAIEKVIETFMGNRYINVWDAGCAHGPEPYTLAILWRERVSRFMLRNLRIFATDIEPGFGPMIEKGEYTAAEVGRIEDEILSKYFEKIDNERYRISDELRSSVRFSVNDLLSLSPPRRDFHMIVSKNVLLHLQPPERISVLNMFYRCLVPEGILAMEPTQKLPPDVTDFFEPVSGAPGVYRRISGRSLTDEIIFSQPVQVCERS